MCVRVNVVRILSGDIRLAMRSAMALCLAQAAVVASWAPPRYGAAARDWVGPYGPCPPARIHPAPSCPHADRSDLISPLASLTLHGEPMACGVEGTRRMAHGLPLGPNGLDSTGSAPPAQNFEQRARSARSERIFGQVPRLASMVAGFGGSAHVHYFGPSAWGRGGAGLLYL